MNRHILNRVVGCPLLVTALINAGGSAARAQVIDPNLLPAQQKMQNKVTNAQRQAAAEAAAAARKAGQTMTLNATTGLALQAPVLIPLGVPDYVGGVIPNWANTPAIRKFVDTLPGLGFANRNNLGNYIPIAIADTATFPAQTVPGKGNFPASDYFRIGLVDYAQKLHSDLPPTKLRGYKDLAPGADGAAHYLGPLIIAKRDVPTRIKFVNQLGPSNGSGKLFLPVDTTMMGAGYGANSTYDAMGTWTGGSTEMFPQNRAELHLHGGATPWISDGTPHQWFTPANDPTTYKKGVEFNNVPDMIGNGTVFPAPPAASDGIGTYYYSNQQSSRLMFYHDHAYGLTRLNVYAGEAAGYLLHDDVEDNLITTGILPNQGGGVYNWGIPLIIQDKTFVPDPIALASQDPTWDTANWGGLGNFWFPHVYMPNQDPSNLTGANPMGRWDYGPWFWPPLTAAAGLIHGPIPDPLNPARQIPGTPNPSLVPEAFMDTPLVNGTPYPSLTLQPKAYRFRILNAANDRMFNLSLFYVDPLHPTEVKMLPAVPTVGWPATWPTDGRAGGVPDPLTAGPKMLQIGSEGGFLPTPVNVPAQPIGFDYNRRNIVVLNILDHGLLLGPAERADVIIDFSGVPSGSKLILYNDAPAPAPAFDTRYDYYTGDLDQRTTGGAATTLEGFGPNTRTIMLFNVVGTPAAPFNETALRTAFASTATTAGAYAKSQDKPVVPQAYYNLAFNQAYTDTVSSIQATSLSYTATENGVPVITPMQPKAIQELFELDYGRMNATLGLELPRTNFNIQTTIPLGYADAATELLNDGETQIWKITHNGVDTHPVHFHLFNVQLVNRVGWDGAVRLPDDNERGWKETVRMNPLEDCIVAFRPITQQLPFVVPNSSRPLDPTKPANSTITITDPLTGNPITGTNSVVSNGWEYVWHCHILGHEENDFMRPMAVTVATAVPADPTVLVASTSTATKIDLTWHDNSSNETGFRIERRVGAGAFSTIANVVPNTASYSDYSAVAGTTYGYRVYAYNQQGTSAAPTNIASLVATAPGPATGVIITPSLASPQLSGTAVTFTASGVGGATTYQYQFWLSDNYTTAMVQDYGIANFWTMPATKPAGPYYLQVFVRTSPAVAMDTSSGIGYTLNPVTPATGVTVTPSLASPQFAGTAVTFTASGIGGGATPVYQYQFWQYDNYLATMVQDYGIGSSWTMPATNPAGPYFIQVRVRTSPTVTQDAVSGVAYTLNAILPATGVTVTPSLASPRAVGTPVVFTASGIGGTPTYQYQFWLYDNYTATMVQDYGIGSSWTMPTVAPAGPYYIQVRVRTNPSVLTQDAVNGVPFTLQ